MPEELVIEYVAGDGTPAENVEIDYSDSVSTLAGYTAESILSCNGVELWRRAAEVVAPASECIVRTTWQAGDLATPGFYQLRQRVVNASGDEDYGAIVHVVVAPVIGG